MTPDRAEASGTLVRVAGIASVTALMVLAVFTIPWSRGPIDDAPPAAGPGSAPSTARPIAAEADVFRRTPADLAAPPSSQRREGAHPRTLAMYRSVRAFPGAPPRVPHGLTADEFRDIECNACHERGGFVTRFASYAPVTPHPGYGQCVQCHLPDDALVGVQFPDPRPGGVCFQCHILDAPPVRFVELDWTPAAWPEPAHAALDGAPPPIPHGLELRGDCIACHVAPGAVIEIRTDHPERTSCRQCHVTAAGDADAYTRDPSPAPTAGGAP